MAAHLYITNDHAGRGLFFAELAFAEKSAPQEIPAFNESRTYDVGGVAGTRHGKQSAGEATFFL